MKAALNCLLVLVLGVVSSCAKPPKTSMDRDFRGERYKNVVVVVEDPSGYFTRLPGVRQDLHSRVSSGLMEKGYSSVVRGTQDLDKLLSEVSMRNSGLTDGEAARVGKMASAEGVVVLSISSVNTSRGTCYDYSNGRERRYSCWMAHGAVSCRLIDVEYGKYTWQGAHSGDEEVGDSKSIGTVLQSVTDRLIKDFPDRDKPVKVTQK